MCSTLIVLIILGKGSNLPEFQWESASYKPSLDAPRHVQKMVRKQVVSCRLCSLKMLWLNLLPPIAIYTFYAYCPRTGGVAGFADIGYGHESRW